jgi:ubiquinone/menaquinone biosynthesis C-methylase UbiE
MQFVPGLSLTPEAIRTRFSPVYEPPEQLIYEQIAEQPEYRQLYTDPEQGLHRPLAEDDAAGWLQAMSESLLRQEIGGAGLILDLGCGVGWPALPIAHMVGSVIGLDASMSMISLAAMFGRVKEIGNVTWVRGDAHALPLPDAGVDHVVMAGGTLQVLRSPAQVLAEVYRVLRPGGGLIATAESSAALELPSECGYFTRTSRGLSYFLIQRLAEPLRTYYYYFMLDPDHPAISTRLDLPEEELEAVQIPMESWISSVRKVYYTYGDSFDANRARQMLREAGFSSVSTRPSAGVLSDLFSQLADLGLLSQLLEHRDRLCTALAAMLSQLDPGRSQYFTVSGYRQP